MSVDPGQQRLFAAAPADGTIEIVDLKTGKALRSMEGEKPAAVRFAPEFDQLYATRGQSVYIYDGKTLDQVAKVNLDSNLDELQYDPRAKRLYAGVMAADKFAIAILSLPDGKLLGQIKLPAKPQGFIVEQKGRRIFANIPALKQIAVIDRESRTLLEPWSLAGTQANYPIDLDEERHRLFVGCRQPARMVVFDTDSGKPVANIDISGDTDDLFYDSARKRVYVLSGDGSIDVIDQRDADHYQTLRRIPTVAGARNSALSVALNVFCLGVPRRGSEPAEIRVFRGVTQGQGPSALAVKGRIDLPNVDGRIDHFSADVKGRRLFMSALGNHTVEVLDPQSGKRVHTIPDLAEPQGLYYDPSWNRLFVACASDGATKVFEGSTFQLLDTAKFFADADNIRYDARAQRVIVGFGEGALAFLDSNGKKTGEIALDAHPESFQLEKSGTRAFVNVPDKKEIQVLDLVKNAMSGRWPVTSALKNYPMALDEANHRLLIGCRAPARMLVIDTETGKQMASVEIVGDTDDLFYDAAKRRVYVIGGQGFVDVFEQKDPDRYDRIAHQPTAPGARTGFYVPDWGNLFVAVPHRGEQRAEVLVYDVQ